MVIDLEVKKLASEQILQQLANILASEGLNASQISSIIGMPLETTIILTGILLLAILIWSLILKGIALWKSAKNSHKIWFIILLVVNTIGILEILYIYVFSKINLDKGKQPRKVKKAVKRK